MIVDPHRTYPCRCRDCGARKRLREKRVDTYRCPCGGEKGMRIDRFRDSRENGPHNTCTCDQYHFPHHIGRGFCIHNPAITADDMRRREEEGNWPSKRRR